MEKITENSVFTIKYFPSGFIQTKRILTSAEVELFDKNKATWKGLDVKEKAKFEKNNKIRSDFGEVHPESAIGLGVMGKGAGDICSVTLPEHQGGIFELEILNVK